MQQCLATKSVPCTCSWVWHTATYNTPNRQKCGAHDSALQFTGMSCTATLLQQQNKHSYASTFLQHARGLAVVQNTQAPDYVVQAYQRTVQLAQRAVDAALTTCKL